MGIMDSKKFNNSNSSSSATKTIEDITSLAIVTQAIDKCNIAIPVTKKQKQWTLMSS